MAKEKALWRMANGNGAFIELFAKDIFVFSEMG